MKHLKQHQINNSICPDCGENKTETLEQFFEDEANTFTTINRCLDCQFAWVDAYDYARTKSA